MMNLFKHPILLPLSYLFLRMILSPFSPVPGAVALDPLWMFAVYLHLKNGKGWVFSLVPAMLIGDWMAGLAWAQIFLRTGGFLLLAGWPKQGGFNHLSLFWVTQHALWSSLMPDWLGYYPLGYVYAVWLIQGLLWWGLFAPLKDGGSLSPVGSLLIAPVVLLLFHLLLPSPDLWPLPELGEHSQLWLQIVSGMLLFIPIIIFFIKKPRPERNPIQGNRPGRWTHLAE